MMAAMVLWYSVEMSSTLGGSESWSTSAALAWMVVVVWVFGIGGILDVVMVLVGLVEIRRRVMRLIFYCVRFGDGGWSLVSSTPVGG